MLPPAPQSMGLFSNVASGYALSWRHRRVLVPVLLPVLVPLLTALFAADLIGPAEAAPVINGQFSFASNTGPWSWLALAMTASGWLLALTAGTAAMVGEQREHYVSPARALLAALRHLPYLVLGLAVLFGAGLVVAWLAAAVASVFGGLGPVVFLTLLAGAALAASRLALSVVTVQFGGSAWQLTSGRVFATAGAFLLGGLVLPLLAAALASSVRVAVVWPFAADILMTLIVLGSVAVQAGILASVYVSERAAAATAGSDDDLNEIDTRLIRLAGRPWPWKLIAITAVVPMVLPSAAALANPYGTPAIKSHGGGPPGGPVAMAWPPGQHPIIVSTGAVRFCNDDPCTSHVIRNGSPGVMDGWGAAGISRDGTVVTGSVTGGEDSGGPFIHYGRCTRDAGCGAHHWLPARGSSDEPFAWPMLALTGTADGAVLFALAFPPPPDQARDGTAEIKLIRCADAACTSPQRFSLGTVKGWFDLNDRRHRSELTISADGRPTAHFWLNHAHITATCDPVSCANPSVSNGTDERGYLPAEVASSGGNPFSPAITPRYAVTLTGQSGIYAAYPAETVEPSGFRLTIGQRPEYWRYMLIHCPDSHCAEPHRVPLDIAEGQPFPIGLTVSQDGNVLVARGDRIIFIPKPG